MVRKSTNAPDFMYCLCAGSYVNVSDKTKPLTCKTCEKPSHRVCTCYSGPDEEFECSLCKVQLLDPFNSVVDFLWYGRMGNKSTIFKVDVPQLETWASQHKDVYVVSLPLSKNKLMHEWPKTFELRINNEMVHIVKEPNWEHPRRDNPIKVTYAMRPGENLLELFSTTYNDGGPFFLVIIMISKQVTVERMIETIKKRRTIPFDEAKKRILELINKPEDDDEVLCMEQNRRIELNCPITMDRIEFPTRGKHCKHLQCFDLNGYLQVMQNTSTFNTRWKCPECQLIIKPMDLVIDGYILKILETVPQSTTAVELDKSGKYKAVKNDPLWDDAEYQAELAAMKNVTNTSNRNSSSSVYTTSVLSEKSSMPSLSDRKFNPSLIGGVHVKLEQGRSSIFGCVIDLDSDDDITTTRSAASVFAKGEVISLDSSDEDESQRKYTRPSSKSSSALSAGGHSTAKAEGFPPAPRHIDRGRNAKSSPRARNGSANPKQGTVAPPTTLSQRLSQLPKVADTPKPPPKRAANPRESTAPYSVARKQGYSTTTLQNSVPPASSRSSSATAVKIKPKVQASASSKRFSFFK